MKAHNTLRSRIRQSPSFHYFKIPCGGADGAPSPLEVNTFVFLVERALKQWRLAACRDSRWGGAVPVVLVHCTHGFNRTGAMLAHYSMRREGAKPDLLAAMNRFAAHRPPGIYKESYIASLFEYYHDMRPLPPHAVCPPPPAWRPQPEGPPMLRDEDVPEDDLWGATTLRAPAARRRGSDARGAAMSNDSYMAAEAVSSIPPPCEMAEPPPAPVKHDDLLGEEVPDELADSVRSCIRELTVVSPAEAELARAPPPEGVDFPGSQPVSVSLANAGLLSSPELDYMVSWKADGTRYLALLLHGGAYLLDRAGRVRRVQLRLPTGATEPGRPHKPLYTHEFSLLDGEMIVNVAPSGERQRVFLAYDCCALGRTCGVQGLMAGRSFRERHLLIDQHVVAPKREFHAASRGRYAAAAEPFRIECKAFFEPERIGWLLRELIPTLQHPCDGLILQPGSERYQCRTNEHLLKWKRPELNTVDFRVDLSGNEEALQVLGDGELRNLAQLQPLVPPGLPSPVAPGLLYCDAEPGEDVVQHGAIAECMWNARHGRWSLLRIRRDKNHPNHQSVFIRVWQSICDNLQATDVEERLLAARSAAAVDSPAGVMDAGAMGGGST